MSRERQPLCAAAAQPHTSCWQVLAFFEGDGDEGLQAFVEPFVIMLILVINAIVGVWQEHNAENALDALKEMQTTTTKVLRNGVLVPDVPSSELVPGDVVDVRVGDKVPADVRIIKLKTTTIKTDEGSLTGESETVLKQLEVVAKDVRIQGKLNMMFSGTTISNGAAIGVVTATGMRTEIGKIQANVTEAKEDEARIQAMRKEVQQARDAGSKEEAEKAGEAGEGGEALQVGANRLFPSP